MKVTKGVEDTVRWMGVKSESFSIKAMYRNPHLFPLEVHLENCAQPKMSFFFFCMGVYLWKDSHV